MSVVDLTRVTNLINAMARGDTSTDISTTDAIYYIKDTSTTASDLISISGVLISQRSAIEKKQSDVTAALKAHFRQLRDAAETEKTYLRKILNAPGTLKDPNKMPEKEIDELRLALAEVFATIKPPVEQVPQSGPVIWCGDDDDEDDNDNDLGTHRALARLAKVAKTSAAVQAALGAPTAKGQAHSKDAAEVLKYAREKLERLPKAHQDNGQTNARLANSVRKPQYDTRDDEDKTYLFEKRFKLESTTNAGQTVQNYEYTTVGGSKVSKGMTVTATKKPGTGDFARVEARLSTSAVANTSDRVIAIRNQVEYMAAVGRKSGYQTLNVSYSSNPSVALEMAVYVLAEGFKVKFDPATRKAIQDRINSVAPESIDRKRFDLIDNNKSIRQKDPQQAYREVLTHIKTQEVKTLNQIKHADDIKRIQNHIAQAEQVLNAIDPSATALSDTSPSSPSETNTASDSSKKTSTSTEANHKSTSLSSTAAPITHAAKHSASASGASAPPNIDGPPPEDEKGRMAWIKAQKAAGKRRNLT